MYRSEGTGGDPQALVVGESLNADNHSKRAILRSLLI
jgi:hypothetical protein